MMLEWLLGWVTPGDHDFPPQWLAVLPLLALLLGGAASSMMLRQPILQRRIGLASLLAYAIFTLALLLQVSQQGVVAIAFGNWAAPFGIAFAIDI